VERKTYETRYLGVKELKELDQEVEYCVLDIVIYLKYDMIDY
jgi:hypothetical protein